MTSEIQLAIVIPAYKPEFLEEALASLRAQTNRRFRVYVGDDASPGPLREICERYRGELDLLYHRFAENLGRQSLVDQWHRCIGLSSEPWIWLFSDDDVVEPGCVTAFYAALEETQGKYDLYRFNTLTIDEQGKVLEISPPHPPVESGLEFAYHRLCRNRSSFVSEYIFSRRIFTDNKGMIKFPLGWCSDDASWIAFAGERGMFTIYGPRVRWRKSRLNLSYASRAHRAGKIEACGLFLKWLTERYDEEETREGLQLDIDRFRACCKEWLHSQLVSQAPTGPFFWMKSAGDPKFSLFGGPAKIFLTLFSIDLTRITETILNRLAGLLNKVLKPSAPE